MRYDCFFFSVWLFIVPIAAIAFLQFGPQTQVPTEPKDLTVRILHESSPKIQFVDDFLTPEECQELINLAEKELARSTVAHTDEHDHATEKSVVDSSRTSSGMWLRRDNQHPLVQKLLKGAPKLAGFPRSHAEDIQILRYEISQQYVPHYDYFDPKLYPAFLQNGGQRMASFLCFLNEVEQGGHTVFPKVNVSVAPKKGGCVWWSNVHPDASLDEMSLHGGAPVEKGKKYVAVMWFREKPFA